MRTIAEQVIHSNGGIHTVRSYREPCADNRYFKQIVCDCVNQVKKGKEAVIYNTEQKSKVLKKLPRAIVEDCGWYYLVRGRK